MAKICIIEDDVFLSKVYEAKLKMMGHSVLAMSDGGLAIKAIKKQKPNLVLLDIMLPHMTGFEILGALRKLPAPIGTVPVMVISKLSSEEDKNKALQLGADQYIGKVDTNIKTVLDAVKERLGD